MRQRKPTKRPPFYNAVGKSAKSTNEDPSTQPAYGLAEYKNLFSTRDLTDWSSVPDPEDGLSSGGSCKTGSMLSVGDAGKGRKYSHDIEEAAERTDLTLKSKPRCVIIIVAAISYVHFSNL